MPPPPPESLLLLVEESPSMRIWHPEIQTFERKLREQHPETRVTRSPFSSSSNQMERILSEPSPAGEQLLIFSDFVAEIWNETTREQIQRKTTPTPLLVHCLPSRLWERTRLRPPSKEPGKDQSETLLGMCLDPQDRYGWAGLNVSHPVLLEAGEPGPPWEEDPREEKKDRTVQRFREMVSPRAFDLAVQLSCVPLLPSLIEQVRTRQGFELAHLAEVLLGGILHASAPEKPIPLDFQEGIRETLLGSLLKSELFDLFQICRDHTRETGLTPLRFDPLLLPPTPLPLAADPETQMLHFLRNAAHRVGVPSLRYAPPPPSRSHP